MKSVSFAIVASLLAAPAMAGSLNEPILEPEPAAAASSLPGWYAFGAIGKTFSGPEYTYNGSDTDNVTDISISGFAGTVGFGREFARRGNLSFGFEADLTAGDMSSDREFGGTTPCLTGEEGCTADVNWMSTARLVVGAPQGATMPYLTAGVVFADIEGSADLGACGATECGFDERRLGWTVGAGIRHELSDRWAVKGEVLYVDLGSPDFTTDGVSGDFTFGSARLGMIYKF